MYKIDLHSHSIASHDGGITPEQYTQLLEKDIVDFIAVTDHDTIAMALQLRATLGEKIIVGEEITTTGGELIGLFLEEQIPGGLSLAETAKRIKTQGGLVYVPHPFETVRKGVSKTHLGQIAADIDIVEVYNGRAIFQDRGPQAATWARLHEKPMAASSDAHGIKGVGTAYTVIQSKPKVGNLVELLHVGHCTMQRPPLHTLLYPKRNRLLRKLRRR